MLQKLLNRGLRRFRQPGQPLMVVGMHRSGTSFLTGSLQEAGLELGEYSAWNPHNLKGNRENQSIVSLHDAILLRHGYAWDNPPEQNLLWSEAENNNAKRLIRQFRGIPHWGFKDPRALLFAENWQALLPDLQYVGIFRHPAAVARSLDARGGMPEEQAQRLWRIYNQHLLQLYRRSPFPLLCFDQDESTLHEKLDRTLVQFGLRAPSGERFFSADLKHHSGAESTLPADLDELYRELLSLAI